ncbi:MAG: ABC transporter permease [Oscillospiraceae bacterium]|nr:ABC transporter permease [Oscillospiraceae bacterium]
MKRNNLKRNNLKRNNLMVEAVFTFKCYIRGILFRIIAFLGVVLILVGLNIDKISALFEEDEVLNVGIVISDENFSNDIMDNFSSDDKIKVTKLSSDIADTEVSVMDTYEENYGIIMFFNLENYSVDFHYSSSFPSDDLNTIGSLADGVNNYLKMENLNLNEEQLLSLTQNSINYIPHTSLENTQLISLFANILMFLILVTYAISLGNIILEEKTGRISETLLSYIKPTELLFGKLFGMLWALLIHIAIFVVTFIVAENLFGMKSDLVNDIFDVFTPKSLVCTVAMLLFGYLCFGLIFMCISSFVETVQDSNIPALVQSVFILCSYYVSFALTMHFNEETVYNLSFAPFLSIFTNIVYVSVIETSWFVVLQFILIQVIFVLLTGLITGKLFKRGITKYSKKRRKAKNSQ